MVQVAYVVIIRQEDNIQIISMTWSEKELFLPDGPYGLPFTADY